MFYIWGSGGDRVIAASAGTRLCPICNSPQAFDLAVDYRYWHFWYVLSFVTRRNYLFTCQRCGNGTAADQRDYAPLLRKDPIPFLRRRGWTLPLLLAAPAVALAMVVGEGHQREITALLDAPKVGDVYSVDLSHVAQSMSEHDKAYGELKLIAIEGAKRRFVVATQAWSRKSELRKDERKGRIYEDSYYDADDEVELDSTQIKALQAAGTLFDVHRRL